MKTDKRWRKVQPSSGKFWTRHVNGYKCQVEHILEPDCNFRTWAFIIRGSLPNWWYSGYDSLDAAKTACYRKAMKLKEGSA